jgi:putative CocE/NonD family hydrolase
MPRRKSLAVLGLGMAALAYAFRRDLIAAALKLPPPQNAVGVERDIRIAMPDGVVLLADHYFPKTPGSFPTVLVRSGYGREFEAGLFGRAFAQLLVCFAERGYHVVSQTTRGRFASEGEFRPLLGAREDGLATLDWLAEQPWFNGAAGMWGASWLGYMQWAVADGAPPHLRAIAPSITPSQFYTFTFPDGAFGLDAMLRWVTSINLEGMRGKPAAKRSRAQIRRAVSAAMMHLPLVESDVLAVGEAVPYYREYFEHAVPDDPYWQASDRSGHMGAVSAPVTLVSGWYDFFLRELLADYAALKAAGKEPYLTIGPWYHIDLPAAFESLRQGLAWFDAHLKGARRTLREKAVRVYVMGAGKWREMDAWPPPARPRQYYLHARGRLSAERPADESAPDCYRYDPADPTPAVGGPLFSIMQAGAKNNRDLEARPDVLCYTTARLERDIELMGTARVTLHVRSSLAHTDFFARLCDVRPDGRSLNVSDGLLRIAPGTGEPQPDGSLRIEIVLWPTAYRFRAGNRIRLQVSSGAHPRWSRNLGSGEPLGTGTRMFTANQVVYHDNAHPSAVTLPVT